MYLSSPNHDDYKRAEENWIDWKEVFEYNGEHASGPLLSTPEIFKKFLKEYRVGRTIRKGKSDELRVRLIGLRSSLENVLADPSGKMLDGQEVALRGTFGTHSPPRSLRSAMSKVASFLRQLHSSLGTNMPVRG